MDKPRYSTFSAGEFMALCQDRLESGGSKMADAQILAALAQAAATRELMEAVRDLESRVGEIGGLLEDTGGLRR